VAPRFDQDPDLAGHLALLPASAKCKGMFFRDKFELAKHHGSPEEICRAAGVEAHRYLPFLDYSMHDNLRITVEVARRAHPQLPLGEGLRRLGRSAFDTFVASHVGRVLVVAAGNDVGSVMAVAPRAFAIVMNFGTVTIERPGKGRLISRCSDLPAFIETYQVGVIEGIFAHFRAIGTVRVAMRSKSSGAIEAKWSED
jgi:uncharacterized protein (TIGR02265 family)